MSKPLIYAELLSNIRQVSVIAALDTPCDASTSVKLSADGQKLTLHHDGSTSFLYLPGQVAPLSQLQGPKPGIKELSWRLPLSGSYPGSHVEDAVSSEAPWPATDIKENTGFSCRSCGAPVLRKGIIKSWRNLPSENWAEMMDFWHCHKPDIPDSDENGHDGHSHGDPTTSKGYGANAKFTAQPGVGFVDLTTLLASESDCSGVEVSYLHLRFFQYSLLHAISALGTKKATKLCICESMAWSPIQIPYINTFIAIPSWSPLPFSLKHGFGG